MSNRNPTRPVLSAVAALLALLGAGCASTAADTHTGLYTKPMGNAPVTRNDTPYSTALVCLAEYARRGNIAAPRIAVGRILDMTGKAEQVTGSTVTQGASLFAMTALGKAGARVIERYDTAVPEIELKYANQHLLSDTPERAGRDPQNFRKVFAGQIAGSQYYIVGGVTELNANIHSSGYDGYAGGAAVTGVKATLTNQVYVMNIAMDLRLVDSQTQEVVDMVSYQKQIVGKQVGAGVFDFFGGNIIDVSAGSSGMEPIHLAVRSLVERAVFEFSSSLYGIRDQRTCLDPRLDPLAGRS